MPTSRLIPIVAPPIYHTLRYLLEPIITQEAIVALANRLMHILVHVLTRDDVGARALRLSLYRVDGAVETIDIGLTLPTRDVAHMARLIDLKLEALAATEDAGFGFEAVGLAVTRAETIPEAAERTDIPLPFLPRKRGRARVGACRPGGTLRGLGRYAAAASRSAQRAAVRGDCQSSSRARGSACACHRRNDSIASP